MPERTQRRIDLQFRLASSEGQTPTTKERAWFFDVPSQRDNEDGWCELLNRIFYDANVALRRREPNDLKWLALDSWSVSPVNVETMLAWDGEATTEKAKVHLPWILSHFGIVWEFSACYFVDDAGAYDGMTGYDFSELVLYRAMAEGLVNEAAARAFFGKLYPKGDSAGYFNDRETRLKNIATVRPPTAFRKPAGEKPWVSGPVDGTVAALMWPG
jgi:hypothetical protein